MFCFGMESDRNWSKTRVSGRRAPVLCLSLFPCWYVFPLTTGSKLAFFLQEQSVTKPVDFLMQPSIFLCLFIALRSVLLRQIGILILFFYLGGFLRSDSRQLLRVAILLMPPLPQKQYYSKMLLEGGFEMLSVSALSTPDKLHCVKTWN